MADAVKASNALVSMAGFYADALGELHQKDEGQRQLLEQLKKQLVQQAAALQGRARLVDAVGAYLKQVEQHASVAPDEYRELVAAWRAVQGETPEPKAKG